MELCWGWLDMVLAVSGKWWAVRCHGYKFAMLCFLIEGVTSSRIIKHG